MSMKLKPGDDYLSLSKSLEAGKQPVWLFWLYQSTHKHPSHDSFLTPVYFWFLPLSATFQLLTTRPSIFLLVSVTWLPSPKFSTVSHYLMSLTVYVSALFPLSFARLLCECFIFCGAVILYEHSFSCQPCYSCTCLPGHLQAFVFSVFSNKATLLYLPAYVYLGTPCLCLYYKLRQLLKLTHYHIISHLWGKNSMLQINRGLCSGLFLLTSWNLCWLPSNLTVTSWQ